MLGRGGGGIIGCRALPESCVGCPVMGEETTPLLSVCLIPQTPLHLLRALPCLFTRLLLL